MLIETPSDLTWIEGELPDVSSVPADCTVLAWFVHDFPPEDSRTWQQLLRFDAKLDYKKLQGRLCRIDTCRPHEDYWNSLKWYSDCVPIGYLEKVKYWAWVNRPDFNCNKKTMKDHES